MGAPLRMRDVFESKRAKYLAFRQRFTVGWSRRINSPCQPVPCLPLLCKRTQGMDGATKRSHCSSWYASMLSLCASWCYIACMWRQLLFTRSRYSQSSIGWPHASVASSLRLLVSEWILVKCALFTFVLTIHAGVSLLHEFRCCSWFANKVENAVSSFASKIGVFYFVWLLSFFFFFFAFSLTHGSCMRLGRRKSEN